jgi:hypothetical protein
LIIVDDREPIIVRWRAILEAEGLPADDLPESLILDVAGNPWIRWTWGPPGYRGSGWSGWHLRNPKRYRRTLCGPGYLIGPSAVTHQGVPPESGEGLAQLRCPTCYRGWKTWLEVQAERAREGILSSASVDVARGGPGG